MCYFIVLLCIFFFKQKTAYEMRISDWSSDVCSSDLTSSSVMIVLEGEQPLGADAHAFYDEIVRKLNADNTHVQHVQDFWGDTLTAAGAQSIDGKNSEERRVGKE